jgi:hypothetical protein
MTEERVAGPRVTAAHYTRLVCGICRCSKEQALPRARGCGMVRSSRQRQEESDPVLASELMARLLGAVGVLAGVQRPVLVRRPGRMRLGRADHEGTAASREPYPAPADVTGPGNILRRS